jgi:hypothetical protein
MASIFWVPSDDTMCFLGVGSSGATSRCLPRTWPFTQFIQWCVGSSDAEDLCAKTSLSCARKPSDRPTVEPTIPSVHLVLLNPLLCCRNSSNASKTGGVSSSGGPSWQAFLCSIPIHPMLALTLPPRYRRFIRQYLFLLSSSFWTCHHLSLAYHHLDLQNVYQLWIFAMLYSWYVNLLMVS